MKDIQNRFRKLRADQNLTQSQLAEQFGVVGSAISSYELGTRLPPYETLIKYARKFHVSTDYILGLDDRETIDVSDLTETQRYALIEIIKEFRR